MNAEIDREESTYINHRARHIIKPIKEWIKRLFMLDLIPQIAVFQATSRSVKGRGVKVTIPTCSSQSLVTMEILYRYGREVGHFKEKKGKNKRKRYSPQQIEPKLEGT